MLLYIIRHGDPIYNPDSLTPKGLRQAEAVAHRLSVHGVDLVFSSPLIRARQTANPTCEVLHKECNIEEWTSESGAWRDFAVKRENGGSHWAFSGEELFFRRHPEYLGDKWYEAPCFKTVNAYEGFEKIKHNSDVFIAGLGYEREDAVYKITEPNDKRVAVFCHAGFGSLWMSHLLNISPTVFWSGMDITHSGISIFNFANRPDGYTCPVMLTLSDTSHLYGDRLPMQYNNTIDI